MFFDLSSTKIGRRSLLNWIRGFTHAWSFEWTRLNPQLFKSNLKPSSRNQFKNYILFLQDDCIFLPRLLAIRPPSLKPSFLASEGFPLGGAIKDELLANFQNKSQVFPSENMRVPEGLDSKVIKFLLRAISDKFLKLQFHIVKLKNGNTLFKFKSLCILLGLNWLSWWFKKTESHSDLLE